MLFLLLACSPKPAADDTAPADADTDSDTDTDTDSDADTDTDTDSDTDTDTDTDTAPPFATQWSATGVTLHITQTGSGSWSFGLAETGGGGAGWYAENCMGGAGGWDFCHDDVPATGITLRTVTSTLDVEPNRTTLFDQHSDEVNHVTYVAIDNGTGECWTWGAGTSYYVTGLGCTPQ